MVSSRRAVLVLVGSLLGAACGGGTVTSPDGSEDIDPGRADGADEGNEEDGSTGTDGTGDGAGGDGAAGDGAGGDGAGGDGAADDGAAGDGSAGDGAAGDGNAGDGAEGDGTAGDGAPGDGSAGDGNQGDAPDIFVPFTDLADFQEDVRSQGGSIALRSGGGAEDSAYVALTLPGNAGFGPNDHSGPPYASELIYDEAFQYGKFETRVRFAACRANEEVVNGLFTYFNDGSDQNQNGIADNSEIDIELLCGTPNILWLTTYTDFEDFVPGRLRKLSRKLDMRTGRYEDYVDWPPEVSEQGVVQGVADGAFPDPAVFYTVGFEWRADFVRYYIRLDGREVDLFVIDAPDRVPQRASQFLMNIWHANAHWTDGAAADYPADDATMSLDSLSIWR